MGLALFDGMRQEREALVKRPFCDLMWRNTRRRRETTAEPSRVMRNEMRTECELTEN